MSTNRRSKPPDQRTLPELLARELIGVCMATLKDHGLPDHRLAALATEAAMSRGGGLASSAAVLADTQRLAELTNQWFEDPRYRDSTGRPAVLHIAKSRGCCFARLARAHFPGRALESVVGLACERRVTERVAGGRIALVNSTVLFTGRSLPILAHAVRSVRRFLRTTEFNRRADPANLENWPERTAYVSVTQRDFDEFIRVFRPQISGLVESSNRWLSRRSKRPGRNRNRVVGLQAFVFQE